MSVAGRVLRRAPGRAWLALAADPPAFGEETPGLAERLLERLDLSLPPLVVLAPEVDEPALERMLSDLEDLLGFEIDRLPAAQVPRQAWSEAGLTVLVGGPEAAWAAALGAAGGPALAGRLPEGGLLFASGAAARALGEWVCGPARTAEHGLAWLPGAIVLSGTEPPGSRSEVQGCLREHPRAYALGLPPGAILALGPDGQVESWGSAQPALVLGKGWLDE